MTDWTFFLTIVGAAFLTAQLFRLIDLIERPSRRGGAGRKTLPEPWLLLEAPEALLRRFPGRFPAARQFFRAAFPSRPSPRRKSWTFSKN